MDGQEVLGDSQVQALEAWDRQQRARKRLAALVVALVLVAGFVGAAIVGHGMGHA